MKKFVLLLTLICMFLPVIAEAKEYHPLGCSFYNSCDDKDERTGVKNAGHYRDYYNPVKTSIVRINGESYTEIQYDDGSKAIKKGVYWIR
ncbi:MAG: hypothetical protein NC191_04745 [Muribaculaceae bacterium]|nr:hypothetical protein [Muribaculaceae bacterium]